MKTIGVIVAAALVALGVAGCVRTTDGTAVRASGAAAPATSSTTKTAPTRTAAPTRGPATPPTVPGVAPTLSAPIPPNALLCRQDPPGAGTSTPAEVADPVAPRLVVTVPAGWTSTPGQGDTALTMSGPDGMTGTVTIAATTLDPAAAFTRYANEVSTKAPMTILNTLPAPFCGYSSQRLMGTWAGTPQKSIEFADRLTHIWTNTNKYLVVIHMQGPAGAPGFSVARAALTAQFTVVIP